MSDRESETVKTNFGQPLDSLLEDLCNEVGASIGDVDFTIEDWYLQHSWTIKDEKAFAKKIINKIKKDKKFYSAIFDVSTEKRIKDSVEMFLYTYGWNYKD